VAAALLTVAALITAAHAGPARTADAGQVGHVQQIHDTDR
jgi:hypothetical protein